MKGIFYSLARKFCGTLGKSTKHLDTFEHVRCLVSTEAYRLTST